MDKTRLRKAIKNFEAATAHLKPIEPDNSSDSHSTGETPPRDPSTTPAPESHTDTNPTPSISGTTEDIPRDDMAPEPPNSGFNDAQRRELADIIANSVATSVANALANRPPGGGGNGPDPDPQPGPVVDNRNANAEWKAEDVGFFDPEADGSSNADGPIINSGRHVFYTDVYTFVGRLQDLASVRGEEKLRTVIPQCLRGSALIWHSAELSDLEKNLLRTATVRQWYDALISRFKERAFVALEKLHKERYTFADARERKNPRLYAQNIFRHAKSAEMESVFNQITMAWNNLDWEFRRDIPEPSPDTPIWKFLSDLDSKASIWFEMAKRPSNTRSNQLQRTSKQESRQSGRAAEGSSYYQPVYQSNRSGNYPNRQNQAYQSNRQSTTDDRQQSRGVLPSAKQPLLLTGGSGSGSQKDQKPSANAGRSGNAYRGRGGNKSRSKGRAYVVDEDEEENTDEAEEAFHGVDGDAYYNEDLEYYYPDDCDEDEEPEPPAAHFVAPSPATFACRRCSKQFASNNRLHLHLRTGCPRMQKPSADTDDTGKPFADASPVTSPVAPPDASAYPTEPSSTGATKASSNEKPPVIRSDVDASKDVGTGYGFRGWSYAKAKVSLTEDGEEEDVALDTGAGISLGDEDFVKRQNADLPIRKMASPITVRGLGTTQHESTDYVIASMYFSGIKDGVPTKALIQREIHLVKDLKANMLIGNDIITPEGIVMDTRKQEANIRSCGVTVPLEVRSRASHAQQRPIHAKKAVVLPPRAQLAVAVHDLSGGLPADRDFLFEPDDTELTLYAHLVDSSTKAILATNNTDQPVKIPRNFRLGKLVELDYPHAFQVQGEDAVELAARIPARQHKSSWFKKVISVFAAAAATAASVASGMPQSAAGVSPVASVPSAFGFPASASPVPAPVMPVPVIPGMQSPVPSVDGSPTVSEKLSPDIVMPNGVTIHQSAGAQTFASIVEEFPALWTDAGFAELPEENWMRIPLKSDWEDRVTGKAKVYPLGARDRELVDQTFDELHEQGRMSWTNASTPFSYPAFCVWRKNATGENKGRVVVDIRGLNAITVPDAYPLPLQSDIIAAVRDCPFISVVDASSFFYQWRVHPDDRHKLTVVTHRGQESFNVAVMGYKNSPAYVQRQIDRLLRRFRRFARAYVDDIVIFSKTAEEHAQHLRSVFAMLQHNNISIKPSKAFLGYPSVALLGQKVDSFGLSTSVEKLKAIAKIQFPKTLRLLETYLGLTGYLREYVPFYAGISKSLQARKTELLKPSPVAGNARKSFASRTRVENATPLEKEAFRILQSLLSAPTYLIHHDPARQLFIDLDSSKEFGIGAMVYHVKIGANWDGKGFPPRKSLEPILFLSRLLTSAETRYWPTELEIAGIVWVLKKTRHLIESSSIPTVIYTDHGSALGIAKQTTLTTSSTDKLNLRLVRASDYIQRFNLEIRHKPGAQHIIPDALSRLSSLNIDEKRRQDDEGELDALFTTTLIEMEEAFRNRLLDGYRNDPVWKRISALLDAQTSTEGSAALPFYRENGLIFRSDGYTTGSHAFEPRRLCIPQPLVSDIFATVHGAANGHAGFRKCYEQLASSYYVRGMSRQLRDYLRHCPDCQIHQTRRHKPYGALQPILTPPVPFHTLTIDFILGLPKSREGFDAAMSVTCKFSKRVTSILGKSTWSAAQWGKALLDRLDIADWGIPKAIISDRDRKFLSDLWTEIFRQLGVRLLFSTAYHAQTDGQSERTNQTLEIALRFAIALLENPADWPDLMPKLQRALNNSVASTGHTPNEVAYGFTPAQPDLMPQQPSAAAAADLRTAQRIIRAEVADAIALGQMYSKQDYDRKHQPLYMKVGDWALLRLHKGYKIPATARLGKKLSQQYVGPFQITEKIGRLAYRLAIPETWRIHPVFTVAQLEPVPPPSADPFSRPRPTEPDSVFVEGDTERVKSYEVERLLNKRQTARRGVEYLVKWKGYGPQHDAWRSLPELGDAMDLVKEYEEAFQQATSLTRLEKPSAVARRKPATTAVALRKPSATTVSPQNPSPAAPTSSAPPPFAVVIRNPSPATAGNRNPSPAVATGDDQQDPPTGAVVLRRSNRLRS